MNMTASKAETALQMLTYDGEKKAWNCEKYVSQHIIFENLTEYEYQGLNTGSKVYYLLNGIRCKKVVAIMKVC